MKQCKLTLFYIIYTTIKPVSDYPISGNNTFETSDFADLRFSFRSNEGVLLSLSVLMEKIIAKH